MTHISHPHTKTRTRTKTVRRHIARSLVGQTVDLLVDAQTIVHGVVTAVMTEAGAPKLVVGGNGYDLSQILTAMPASLDQQLQSQH
ncbi:MAG: hypothetical protein U1F65_00660 [Verrucomicrobiota bacterium]